MLKRRKRYILLLLLLVICLLGTFRNTFATESSFFKYVTEMSIGENNWIYGSAPVAVEANAEEPEQMSFVLYFTKWQWRQLVDDGILRFNLPIPSQIKIISFQREIIAELDGEIQSIGQLQIKESELQFNIDEAYQKRMEGSDNIEIRISMIAEFEEGEYGLGDGFKIISVLDGKVSARWNNYSVKVNKIDEEDSAKLLEGADFEIDVSNYADNARAYAQQQVFLLEENAILENDTFKYKNSGFSTIKNVAAFLEGGFAPGDLYTLREIKPPIGYLPTDNDIKFAFYHYSDTEKIGTRNKIKELNENYKVRYENVGGVAVFGNEDGSLDMNEYNIYVKNKLIPKIELMKIDAATGEPLAGVKFELQINAKQSEYAVQEYLDLRGAEWICDETSGILSWTGTTDQDGVIIYPKGTIPYSVNEYTLIEYVPAGYEGHGKQLATKFMINKDGTISITEGNGRADAKDGLISLIVENKRVINLEINKVNETEKPLENATFVLYGLNAEENEDSLKIDGKIYYYIESKTTGKDGQITFYDLPLGEYYLKETEAPEGYKILEEPYFVELNEESESNGENVLTIVNSKKGVKIVSTGGKGILPYLIGGIVLVGVGRMLLGKGKKKKKRKKTQNSSNVNRRVNSSKRPKSKNSSSAEKRKRD